MKPAHLERFHFATTLDIQNVLVFAEKITKPMSLFGRHLVKKWSGFIPSRYFAFVCFLLSFLTAKISKNRLIHLFREYLPLTIEEIVCSFYLPSHQL